MLSKLPNVTEALLCLSYHFFLGKKKDYISQYPLQLSCNYVIKFSQ